jgi:hypothetical protein
MSRGLPGNLKIPGIPQPFTGFTCKAHITSNPTQEIQMPPSKKQSHPLGNPWTWARDFALVGGVSSFLAPYLVVRDHYGMDYIALSTAMGIGFGAVLGLVLPRILTRMGQIPFWALLFTLGPSLGLLWGAAVGASSGQILKADMWMVSTLFAAPAAAFQFGWLWLPYTVVRAREKRAWPLVAFACVMPVAGLVAVVMARTLYGF